jgi:hypothetical protein
MLWPPIGTGWRAEIDQNDDEVFSNTTGND